MALSKKQQSNIKNLFESGISDDGLYDYCKENKLKYKEVELFIAILNAPDQCKKCEYVTMRPCMYPCNNCKRNYIKDFFKNRSE